MSSEERDLPQKNRERALRSRSYPHEPLYPLLAEAAARFGGARLLWGSNYPVVGDEQDYRNDLQLLLDEKLPFPDTDIPAIAGGNARSLWFGTS